MNTLEKFPKYCKKWIFKIQNCRNENLHFRLHGFDTLENSIQNHNVFSTLNNPKPLFQYPKTFADTLPHTKNCL